MSANPSESRRPQEGQPGQVQLDPRTIIELAAMSDEQRESVLRGTTKNAIIGNATKIDKLEKITIPSLEKEIENLKTLLKAKELTKSED